MVTNKTLSLQSCLFRTEILAMKSNSEVNKIMILKSAISSAMITFLLLCLTVTGVRTADLEGHEIGRPLSAVPEEEKEPVDSTPFTIVNRGNYENVGWITSTVSGKIIGYAPWDAVNKRFTLMSLTSQYRGFVQATVGERGNPDLKKPEHYMQYLWYDRNNLYKGIFITTLGGRPRTRDLPYGEMGGQLVAHSIGNIPLGPMGITLFIDYAKPPMGMDISIRPRLR